MISPILAWLRASFWCRVDVSLQRLYADTSRCKRSFVDVCGRSCVGDVISDRREWGRYRDECVAAVRFVILDVVVVEQSYDFSRVHLSRSVRKWSAVVERCIHPLVVGGAVEAKAS